MTMKTKFIQEEIDSINGRRLNQEKGDAVRDEY